MTTRTKRTAKPRQIEALIGSDRVLLKELMKEALQEVLEAEMTEALGAPARRPSPRRCDGWWRDHPPRFVRRTPASLPGRTAPWTASAPSCQGPGSRST